MSRCDAVAGERYAKPCFENSQNAGEAEDCASIDDCSGICWEYCSSGGESPWYEPYAAGFEAGDGRYYCYECGEFFDELQHRNVRAATLTDPADGTSHCPVCGDEYFIETE